MLSATHMVDRVALTQATVGRFNGKPFRFGSCDCVRLVAWHLRQFGYRPQLSKGGAYKTANGARAALRKAGFSSVSDALDALGLERIAPAAAWVGDIVQGEGDDAFGALGVMLGGDAMLGFHEHAAGAGVLRRVHVGTAWRVNLTSLA
jgi:hypothetical protein